MIKIKDMSIDIIAYFCLWSKRKLKRDLLIRDILNNSSLFILENGIIKDFVTRKKVEYKIIYAPWYVKLYYKLFNYRMFKSVYLALYDCSVIVKEGDDKFVVMENCLKNKQNNFNR